MVVRGFTLIEVSIAILIISLVVGGVAVGKDLLEAAKMRRVYSEYERFSAAAKVFQNRYNCVPGDCANAYLHFGATCGANDTTVSGCNGNGDSFIAFADAYESHKAWRHLSMAKLITPALDGALVPLVMMDHTYVGSVTPRSDWSTDATWGWGDGWNPTELGNAWPNGQPMLILYTSDEGTSHFGFVFNGRQALAFDSKFDDGLPDSGNIHGDHTTDCIVDFVNAYNVDMGVGATCYIGIGGAY